VTVVRRSPRPDVKAHPGAERWLPARRTLPALRRAAAHCRGCPLYRGANQTVFGEGPVTARAVFVGEEPGDKEDLAGQVFVGPAGHVLDEAFEAAGIARDQVYLTNAVKHFKYTQRGKRRIHDKPTRYEIRACRPWLGAELAVIRPAIVVVMGATAAQALLGPDFRVTAHRGHAFPSDIAEQTFATVHPASVLRAIDHDARVRARDAFFADIQAVADALRASRTRGSDQVHVRGRGTR
jgi:uracil-DNA glycosylase